MIDDKKLTDFRRLVFEDAERQRDDTLSIVESEKKRRLSEAKAEIAERYKRRYNREMTKIKNKFNEELSTHRSRQKSELLSARDELKNSVFISVEKKLSEFIRTEKYGEYMKSQIEKAIALLNCDNAVIIINADDEILKSSGYEYEVSDEDFKGGCIVTDKAGKHRVDLTMKTKLSKLRNEFLQTYKLKLQE